MQISSRRRWLAAGALMAALALAVGSYAVADALRYAPAPARIEIASTPIEAFDNRDPSRVRFGDLEFRGGLVLTAKNGAFGGISGLHVESDGGRFIAVTDRGSWLRGRIVYRDGRPGGIADAEIAPILGADGKPRAAHGRFDAEALTERGGMLYLGIERIDQVMRFDYRKRGLRARGEPVVVPSDFKSLANNRSLECLAAAPRDSALSGTLIAVTEQSLDAAGNFRSFLLKGDRAQRFSVARSDDFDVSDCAVLPPADLLLLERRFSLARGPGMRIRRVPFAALEPGAPAEGRTLVEADLAYQIDNMEGIAVHRNARGETIVTLVSDDNFSMLQRNLLLQFALVGE
jgi:hypothetical protein